MNTQETSNSIATQPKPSWLSRFFSPITPTQIVAKQLRDAEVDLLTARAAAEFYTYQANMLNSRVSRLRQTNLER